MKMIQHLSVWSTRALILVRRRSSKLRHRVSPRGTTLLLRGWARAQRFRNCLLPVRHDSRFDQIYHCCVHKTGSQWLQAVFSDPAVYRYSGLNPYSYELDLFEGYEPRPHGERTFDRPFPPRIIATPVYLAYDEYEAIPKAGPARAFFVVRDPRDLIVSWYFSAKSTHILMASDPDSPLRTARRALQSLSLEDGLHYAIDYHQRMGRFDSLSSWAEADDANARLVHYEELIGEDSFGQFRRLFDFLDVQIPERVLASLLDAYSFRRLAGRPPGAERLGSHLRSGGAGGWRRYLSPEHLRHLRDSSADLVDRLGYSR